MLSFKRYVVNMAVAFLPPTRVFGLKRLLWRFTGDSVAPSASINGGAKVWGAGRVVVGHRSWLGMNILMIVPAGAEIRIGANVDIGPEVLFECGEHEIGRTERRAGAERATSIVIGAGTWIGCRVTLLGGARLGTGTVVAAGAMIVAGDYPDDVLLAGVPARVVRQLDETTDHSS